MSGRAFGDDDIIDETTLFEMPWKIYYLSQWRNKDGYKKQNTEYIDLRNEFIDKLRKKYPQMTDAEIFNFFQNLPIP